MRPPPQLQQVRLRAATVWLPGQAALSPDKPVLLS